MKESIKPNIFTQRPIMAFVIAILIVVIGLVSLQKLPMEQYPDLSPPVVEVSATYTGANALSIENSVASPLEQEINGVDNMIYMKSTNANDGTMSLQISFEVGTDPDMNTVFTQNKVASATPKLPEEVKRYGVVTQKSLPNILLLISLTSSNASYDQNFLSNYAILNIKDVLSRIKGVGRVNIFGGSDYSMRIWVKPDVLANYNISVTEIINSIRAQNIIVPGGKFGAEPSPPNTEFTYTVRLPERLSDEKEFGEIIIKTNPDGSSLKIKDIARVELGVETYGTKSRTNRDKSALIPIYQAPGSNAVDLAKNIIATMAELSKDFPPGIEYGISLDTTKPITEGLKEIVITLVIALILVIIVVFIFLQDWRATLIPSLAIPISLVGTFIVFPLLGFTINVLSLLGLVLAIGIVVDDAIIVVEAVQNYINEGHDNKTAVTLAMKDVTAPVLATTLVLVAVFIPVSAISGITGRLYQQFAITVAVSVCISSLNALTLSPALCYVLLKKQVESTGPLAKIFHKFNTGLERTNKAYIGLTEKITKKIGLSLLFMLGILIAGLIFGRLIPAGFIPEEDQGYLFVNVQLPDASSLQRTDAVCLKIEDILAEIPEIDQVSTVAGFSLLSRTESTNVAFMFVALHDWAKRDASVTEVTNRINYLLAKNINQAQAFAFGPPAIPGIGTGSGFSMILQDKGGNSPNYLSEHAMKFLQVANQRPEILSAYSTFRSDVPQKMVELDRPKILKTGVKLSEVYDTFGAFLGGAYVNDFNKFGRLYKTFIQAEASYRQDAKTLDLFFVNNSENMALPLSTLVQVKDTIGPDYTNRFNLYRSVEVNGGAQKGFSSAQAMKALEEVASEQLPSDMGYTWSAMSYQEKKASGSSAIVFAFSLFMVYLILAALYESWSLPLSILLGTPFAIFGAFLFLYLARLIDPVFENNVYAQISVVMLIAMAAKNAILIIEFAKIKFDDGAMLFDAAIESAKSRFRPILMTAFSFILGIMPLIFASGSGAYARKVMGMALFGGMSLATILGIFMYPMLFVFIGKIAKYEKDEKHKKHKKT